MDVPGSITTKKGVPLVDHPEIADARVMLVALRARPLPPKAFDTGAPLYDLLLLPLTAIKLLVFYRTQGYYKRSFK